MDGAGADDDEEAVVGVGVLDYGNAFFTRLKHGLLRGGRLGDFVLQEIGRGERVVATDWREGGELVSVHRLGKRDG